MKKITRIFFLISLLLIGKQIYAQSPVVSSVEAEEAEEEAIDSEAIILDYELERTKDFKKGYKTLDQRSVTNLQEMSAPVLENHPESFAGYYLKYKQSSFSQDALDNLKKAELLTLNKTELYSDFLATAHVLGKTALAEEYSSKIRNSGFIQTEVLEYNKNVLRSIKENQAFLFTNGWEDTYPLLTLLKAEKKENLSVINAEWIMDNSFRTIIAGKLGVSSPAFNGDPYEWMNQVVNASQQPIYYSPTLPTKCLRGMSSNITPVGLLFHTQAKEKAVQKELCLAAWKRFSKVELVSSHEISKNYILILSVLESLLVNDPNEAGTLAQVIEYKTKLIAKFPALK